MKIYDCIIIGGGVVGISIARELSKYKLNLAVLEKEIELAFGVSKSNSGIIHPGTQNDPALLKSKLCVEGNRLTKILSRELGVEYREVGELIVAFNDEDIRKLLEIKKNGQKLKVPGLKIVDKPWISRHEPNLNKNITAALYAPTAGIISPYRWVYDMSENAIQNGVEVFTLTKVEKIVKTGVNFEIHSSKGQFTSRFLVNASGLFADEVSRMVGVDDFTITPRKGEEFILDKKKEYITKHLIFPLPTKTSKGVLMIKTSDGNPMIGPTAEDVGSKRDLTTTREGLNKVLEGVRRLVPSVDESDIIAYFAGLRPVSGDDFIIRHEDKSSGFINVAGIQSPGLTAAPAIAIYVKNILRSIGLKLDKKFNFKKKRVKDIHLFNIPLKNTKKLIKHDPAYGDVVCRCELVSAREIKDAIKKGAVTMDGIKFRTRAQSGRCHGSFCTTRIMKILKEEKDVLPLNITKRGEGSEIVKEDRGNA